MPFQDGPCIKDDLVRALVLMTEALAILDKVEAPGLIGSTLDLAIAKLAERFGDDGNISGGRSLRQQLEQGLSRGGPHGTACPCPWENR